MPKTLKRRAAFVALARELTSGARGGPSLSKRLTALPRMFGQTFRGAYDGSLRLVLMAVAVVYIVSPIDFIPDFILGFGQIDDAGVAVWLAGAILSETSRYLEWEKDRDRVVVP